MKKIRIQDKEYPLRVTMGAMVRFKRASGKEVSKIGGDDMTDVLLFAYCCVQSACKADGVDFDLSFDDFADLLEVEDFSSFFSDMQQEAQKKTT